MIHSGTCLPGSEQEKNIQINDVSECIGALERLIGIQERLSAPTVQLADCVPSIFPLSLDQVIMLDFPPNPHGLEFWDQFSNDPAVFRAQVISGIYFEISVRTPVKPTYPNEVGLAQLVHSSYGKWRFNPVFVEENLGPAFTKAMRDYHLEVQKEREEADADRRVFEEQLHIGPPTPPSGDYFWHEVKGCFSLNDTNRFGLWATGLGYFPQR